MIDQMTLDQLCINTIPTLSIDAIQKANSGHPGTPMDAAPTVYCLWQRFLRYDPQDPEWPNRDRFVLSNGHASAMLYSLIFLAGIKAANPSYEQLGRPAVTLDDLKAFRDRSYRQLGGLLRTILDSIQGIHARGLWLEIVTLVVPGLNDDPGELREAAQFIAGVSPDIPWHVTAFHPDYRMDDRGATPARALVRAAELGVAAGLRYVYAGNLPAASARSRTPTARAAGRPSCAAWASRCGNGASTRAAAARGAGRSSRGAGTDVPVSRDPRVRGRVPPTSRSKRPR